MRTYLPADLAVPGSSIAEVERWLIINTLGALKGNKAAAAKILGIDRRTLYRKLELYKIDRSETATVNGSAA